VLHDQLSELVHASFGGIWLVTREADEAERTIAKLCAGQEWDLTCWDCARGLYKLDNGGVGGASSPGDPIAPLSHYGTHGRTTLLLLHNYHHFVRNPVVMQHLINRVLRNKTVKNTLVVTTPTGVIPMELDKLFAVVEHKLPTPDELVKIAGELVDPDDPGCFEAERAVIANATGLTRYEAENAFTLSLVRHEEIRASAIAELKAQMLEKSGLLKLHRGREKFQDLGGLDAAKDFCQRAVLSNRGRGVMLLGVPGSGKSALAKALGNETQRPTLLFDVGALKGGIVGESEQNIRRALAIADAMAPCVLFIDEVEKALAGTQSSGKTDGGVTSGMFGTLLTWLNDHESDVFVVTTANDVSQLPPEFTRAERFDAVFFVDLPGGTEREVIWRMYRNVFGIHESGQMESAINDDQWTGAEIRACCRLAAMLNLPLSEAAKFVVPVAMTASEKVQDLREWATHRCIDATRGGTYDHNPQTTPTANSRRRMIGAKT
jgi:hypothetical protein